jgi:hypothetical protein
MAQNLTSFVAPEIFAFMGTTTIRPAIFITFNLAACLLCGCCCFGWKSCRRHTCNELVSDGSFELPVLTLSSSPNHQDGWPNLQNPGMPTSIDTTAWKISADGTADQISNNGPPQTAIQPNPPPSTLGNPTQLWNTPKGTQFITIGFNPAAQTTISQVIQVALQPGKPKPYHLSFWQSAYNTEPTSSNSIGQVKVELTGPSGNILAALPNAGTFTVPSGSKWVEQAVDVIVPIGAGGMYTIKFTNVGSDAAFIDAVSLCDPN